MEDSGRNTGIVIEHGSEAAGIAVQLSDSKLLYVSEVTGQVRAREWFRQRGHWIGGAVQWLTGCNDGGGGWRMGTIAAVQLFCTSLAQSCRICQTVSYICVGTTLFTGIYRDGDVPALH
jgi:hypothetical protein